MCFCHLATAFCRVTTVWHYTFTDFPSLNIQSHSFLYFSRQFPLHFSLIILYYISRISLYTSQLFQYVQSNSFIRFPHLPTSLFVITLSHTPLAFPSLFSLHLSNAVIQIPYFLSRLLSHFPFNFNHLFFFLHIFCNSLITYSYQVHPSLSLYIKCESLFFFFCLPDLPYFDCLRHFYSHFVTTLIQISSLKFLTFMCISSLLHTHSVYIFYGPFQLSYINSALDFPYHYRLITNAY